MIDTAVVPQSLIKTLTNSVIQLGSSMLDQSSMWKWKRDVTELTEEQVHLVACLTFKAYKEPIDNFSISTMFKEQ